MVLPQTAAIHNPSKTFGNRVVVAKQLFVASVVLNLLLLLLGLFLFWSNAFGSSLSPNSTSSIPLFAQPVTFVGGHPQGTQTGTCYCNSGRDTTTTTNNNNNNNNNQYCMCNPSLAIDLVIRSGLHHVWVVRRRDTLQYACMGGFVQVGETVEAAVERELREEMGVALHDWHSGSTDDDDPVIPELVGVYSDPRRDSRRHTVSVVYAIHWSERVHPVAADDAKEVYRMPVTEIATADFFADHKTILLDYLRLEQQQQQPHENSKLTQKDFRASPGDFAIDIQRSVCTSL